MLPRNLHWNYDRENNLILHLLLIVKDVVKECTSQQLFQKVVLEFRKLHI